MLNYIAPVTLTIHPLLACCSRTTVYTCGSLAGALVRGVPVTANEHKWKAWLSSLLMQGGVEFDHPLLSLQPGSSMKEGAHKQASALFHWNDADTASFLSSLEQADKAAVASGSEGDADALAHAPLSRSSSTESDKAAPRPAGIAGLVQVLLSLRGIVLMLLVHQPIFI